MRSFGYRSHSGIIPALAALFAAATPAAAEDFYRGKQISMIVGFAPGGGYDIYARIVASALPRHIPGSPTIVLRHMQGAGSAIAANFLHSGPASRDGLTIGATGQGLLLAQALKDSSVKFDLREFNWLGRVARSVEMTVAWHTSPIKTFADVQNQELMLATTSAGSTTHSLPLLMQRVTGAKFMLVTGYKGVTESALAMERGEVQGAHATVDGLLFSKANWLQARKISVLVQYGMVRHPSFPDTPAMTELGKTEDDRKILSLFAAPAEVGRSYLAPPGIPSERLEILRRAFAAMLDDPAFAREFAEKKLSFDPMKAAPLQQLIANAVAITPELAERAVALSRE